MTTKTDNIKLPPLPQPRIMPQAPKSKIAYGYSIDDMTTYARAAVEANQPADWQIVEDALIYGIGVSIDGKRIAPQDFYMPDRQDHIADARKMVPSDIDEIMIRVQEYASAWALVGTTFDDGTLMGQAEQSKTRIREALVEFGSSQPAASAEIPVYKDEDDFNQNASTAELGAWQRGWNACRAQDAASAEPTESVGLLRHYGRIPDEVRAAYDKVWAIVFSSPVAAPVAQEPVAYLACDPETGEPVWGEDCVCKDNVYSPEDTGTIGRPVVFAPVAVQPIDVVLHCPACGTQHIDAPDGDWTNPPHRSHLCASCGHIWRPADVATNGVESIKTKGQHDSVPVAAQAQPVINQQMTTNSGQDDQTLADTQRAIIEAAEQRGYARAKAECGQDHEYAKRYTWLRDHPPKDCQGGMRVRIWGESGDWTSISGEKLDVAIDAVWAAKESDHD